MECRLNKLYTSDIIWYTDVVAVRQTKKAGDDMPINEIELNCQLFDQLSILDRLERASKKADCQPVLDEIAFERSQINRKLYQKPPLTDSNS